MIISYALRAPRMLSKRGKLLLAQAQDAADRPEQSRI